MRVSLAIIAAAASLAAAAPSDAHTASPPPARVAESLCIHAGVHFVPWRQWKGEQPDYVLWGHGYFRAHRYDDVTGGPGPGGEGGWSTLAARANGYAGGMSFTLGTWNSAGPPASSLDEIAAAPAREQIRRAIVVRERDGDWHEWPSTSASCGV